MFLLIGLGNPGDEYIRTRHNVGFEVLDAITPNGAWRERKKLHAEVLECEISGKHLTLAKPTTFMNDSGRAAAALLQAFSIQHSAFCILHDDLDLPLGTLRLSDGGSSGGHKGIQSIIEHLKTKDFLRLRIGIGPNTTPDGHRIPAEDFVLKRFVKSERPRVDAAVAKTVEVIAVLVHDGFDAAKRACS